jgi:hypothetical protein
VVTLYSGKFKDKSIKDTSLKCPDSIRGNAAWAFSCKIKKVTVSQGAMLVKYSVDSESKTFLSYSG